MKRKEKHLFELTLFFLFFLVFKGLVRPDSWVLSKQISQGTLVFILEYRIQLIQWATIGNVLQCIVILEIY